MVTHGSPRVSPESLAVNVYVAQSRTWPASWAVTEPSIASQAMGPMPVSQEAMSLDPAPAHQVKRRGYSPYEWAKIFPVLSKSYVDLDMTLPEVMQELSAQHNFHATEQMYKKRIRAWGLTKNAKASEKNAAITELLNDTPVAERTQAIDHDKLIRHARSLVRSGLMEKRSLLRIVRRSRISRMPSQLDSSGLDSSVSSPAQMPSPRTALALPDDLANIDQLIRALQRMTIYQNSELPFGDNRSSRKLVRELEYGRSHWRLHAFTTARVHFEKAAHVIMNWLSIGIVPSMTIIQNLTPGAWAGCADLLFSFSQFILKLVQLHLSSRHPLSLVTFSLQKVPQSLDRDFCVWNCIFNHYRLSADNQDEWHIIASSRLKCCRENGMSEQQLKQYADVAIRKLTEKNLSISKAEIDHAFRRGINHKAQREFEKAIKAFEQVIQLAGRRASAWDHLFEIEANRELAHIYGYENGDITKAKTHFIWAIDLSLQHCGRRDHTPADCLRDLLLFCQTVGLESSLKAFRSRYCDTYNHLGAITEGLWARKGDVGLFKLMGDWQGGTALNLQADLDTEMNYED